MFDLDFFLLIGRTQEHPKKQWHALQARDKRTCLSKLKEQAPI